MKVKHYELVEIANQFLEKNYQMGLEIPVEFNTRIKRVLGRFMYDRKDGSCIPTKIQMSVDLMMSHPREHIIDIFKHELVHYALCAKGYSERQFNDGHPIFEGELKKLGISATHTYDYLGLVHKYTCKNCGKVYEKKRRLVKTAYCMCSESPNLIYNGEIMKKHESMVAFQGDN